MFKSTRWCVLWLSVVIVAAGCNALAVATPRSEPTLEPTPVLATPRATPVPSPRLAGTSVLSPLFPPPLPSLVPATDSRWHHYWRPTGKPVQVHDLAVDGEWLWIATAQGLMRVNQHTLVYERFSHTGGLPGVPVKDASRLLVDDEGRLWAGGRDGLARYDDDSGWTMITTMSARNFALDAWGNIWVFLRERHGLVGFRFQGQEQLTGDDCESERIVSIPDWDDCETWRFLATSWLKYGSRAECIVPVNRRGTARDAGGVNWSIKFSDSLWICSDGEAVQAVPRSRGDNRAIVAAGVKDGVWIGWDEGLFYGENRSVQEYVVVADKLVAQRPAVHALAFSNGSVWASSPDGILRLDEEQTRWQPVTTGMTIPVGRSSPIAAGEQNGLWVLGDDTLAHFDGQTWQHWNLPGAVQRCGLKSRAIGEFRGQVWVAAGTCGLWRFDGEMWNRANVVAGVAAFARGLDGKFYAVNAYGFMYVYDGARWVELLVRGDAGGLGSNSPVIAIDVDGSIRRAWVGGESKGYLWRYTVGEMWDDPLQLPVDFIVSALLADSQGNLWVGGPRGLLRCDEQVCQSLHFANDDARSDPYVHTLAEDPQGRVWVGGRGWLSVYDPAE